ncbi:putative surface protease GP63, putative,metallopeptidase [Trypanosoma grayi]|uniref:putative surface protease GP63, putative,metallopeptidase n=1 Tax=Trypanosoma grayi TaxID=71804 RepID=UPI0004F42020|nr:putative surface protease GP63, putative,metallopeptidase [Trypanosoma grayi]KEG05949.1 putative surface protease GP63, putative,metallopeptidase [Trypanosoma grayi]
MAAEFDGSAYLYTALTMAAFEDMGFFRANWGMEEPMSWGSNAGCGLLKDKCMTNGVTKYPGMFCSESGVAKCSSDRLGFGKCSFDKQKQDIPPHFQYFTNPKVGNSKSMLTDYCPVVEKELTKCSEATNSKSPGSVSGKNSWCLDADSLVVNGGDSTVKTDGVCAAVSCAGGAVKVRYLGDEKWHSCPEGCSVCAAVSCAGGAVKVRYLGDEKWHSCPEGCSLRPSMTSSAFASGTIKCPKYTEVCTIASNGSSLIHSHSTRDTSSSYICPNIGDGSAGVLGIAAPIVFVAVFTTAIVIW